MEMEKRRPMKLEDILKKISKIEEYLNDVREEKAKNEEQMMIMRGSLSHLGDVDSLFTDTKEEMTTKIENMGNTAASVLCSLSNQQTRFLKDDIIGVVALLGSVQSPELSRMLAEYLGEDKMLAVICRSLDTAISLEKYKQNGEIDYERALHAKAAGLGKAISKRFLVMCFEHIRPINKYLPQENDSQRKLVLPDPKLPNGRTPASFMGYAVNMIDLDTHHLQTRTKDGYGLRETVLFSLFKKLQVYETRESMMAALYCIESDGAVSLDGGILREIGTLSLGYGNPSIYFPCTNKFDNSPQAKEIFSKIKEKKKELQVIEEFIEKANKYIQKYKNKYQKKQKKYKNLVDTTVQPLSEIPVPKPEFGTHLVNLGDVMNMDKRGNKSHENDQRVAQDPHSQELGRGLRTKIPNRKYI